MQIMNAKIFPLKRKDRAGSSMAIKYIGYYNVKVVLHLVLSKCKSSILNVLMNYYVSIFSMLNWQFKKLKQTLQGKRIMYLGDNNK